LGLFLFLSVAFLHAQRTINSPATATLQGSVTDSSGALLPGATVVLEDAVSHKQFKNVTDNGGAFSFLLIPSGNYSITFTAPHFISVVKSDIHLSPGEFSELPVVVLQPAQKDATITVHAGENYELAEEQLQVELHQRVLGIIPNFYVTYDQDPTALSSKQKYRLALRATFDSTTIFSRGMMAGLEQADDTFPGYGQGMQGYGKRYGSVLANDFLGNMFAYAVFPSLLHQDPRYYYQGTGTISSRLGHALISPFSCKGDNGRRQINYSNIFGTVVASGISNVYYTAADRKGYQLTLDNSAIGFASDALSSVFQEFFLKKLMGLGHKKKQADE
jgi:hypothetical protein